MPTPDRDGPEAMEDLVVDLDLGHQSGSRSEVVPVRMPGAVELAVDVGG